MNDANDAFELAEERIAQAKAEGWKYLNLSGNTGELEVAGESRGGDERLRALDRVPDSLAELSQLERLDLDYTQVTDLRPLSALSNLQQLDLDSTQVADLRPLSALSNLQVLDLHGTQVADLRPLSALSNLQQLRLNGTQVADLRPLSGLDGLRFIYFWGIPACQADPDLDAISKIQENAERLEKLRAWLAKQPPPEPLTLEDLPEQLDEVSVEEADGVLELRPGAPSPDDTDPLRKRLHERLRESAGGLMNLADNRFFRLAPKVRRLVDALRPDFEDLDFVDIWLELEVLLIDANEDNEKRDEPYSPEVLAALNEVITFGGGLVIDTEEVKELERRRDRMRDKLSDARAHDNVISLSERVRAEDELFGERLRAFLGLTNEIPDSERAEVTRWALVRNTMIAAGKFTLAAAAGGVIGSVAWGGVTWIAANGDTILAAAGSGLDDIAGFLKQLVAWARDLVAKQGGGPPPMP